MGYTREQIIQMFNSKMRFATVQAEKERREIEEIEHNRAIKRQEKDEKKMAMISATLGTLKVAKDILS